MKVPNSAPKVKFMSRMYHPNIAENGVIELAILKKWTVDKDMKSLFDEIKEVLKNPNLDLDYLANIDASNLFLSN